MSIKIILGIVTIVATMATLGTSPAFATAECKVETFTGLSDLPPDTIITNAEMVYPGPFNIPPAPPVATTVPFCRVVVTNTRPPDPNPGNADIYSEVWLPTDYWNGKYLGTGNGGSAPYFRYDATNAGITAGFATANTTMGSHSDPALGTLNFSFGVGHPQRWIDFGYLSTHLMTVDAKAFIKAFYGTPPAYSYFTGCSTGGQQGMVEAQRYPEDYDGIVVGAGAFDRVPTHEKIAWIYQTNHFLNPPKDFTPVLDHYIPLAKWTNITKAVITACDGLDGVEDGLIDDPRECSFDATAMICQGADVPTCLSPGQASTMNQIWRGTFSPKTGKRLVLGMTKGSEWDPVTGPLLYPAAFEGPPPSQPQPPLLGQLMNWAPGLENFDMHYYDWDQDLAIVDSALAPIVNAVNPNLSPFNARGAKLLMYHGWADPLVYSLESTNYYENVLETMGGLNKVKDFARLFMVPGMGHCGLGGPFSPYLKGGTQFDTLGALVNWVEHDQAPDRIIATNPGTGVTRPLCPYPEVARYNGSSDPNGINDASNFMCVPPVEIRIEPETINLKSKGVLTAFITVPAGFDVRDWGISDLKCQDASMTQGSVSKDGRTYTAKFRVQDLKNTTTGKAVTFTVEGLFKKGGEQALLLGFDVVRVIK